MAVSLLAVALYFGMFTSAWAAPGPGDREIASAYSVNQPLVTVEGNAVIDGSKNLTGYFELALKVQTDFTIPGTGDGSDTTLSHVFRSASVALRYNASVLTPVSWDYIPDPNDTTNKPPHPAGTADETLGRIIDISNATTRPVALDTKKPDQITLASAQVEGYTAAVEGTSPASALLVLTAQAPEGGIHFDKETEVVVVRFWYDLKKSGSPDGIAPKVGDGHTYLFPKDTLTNLEQQDALVWFEGDAGAAASSASQVVRYFGADLPTDEKNTAFYYYLDAVEPPAIPVVEDTDPAALTKPSTAGANVLASKDDGGTTKYSYQYNLLRNQEPNKAESGNIFFRLVNKTSYASGGVNLDNLVTILFYDWDDSLIGTLTVERGDARAAVNKYVEERMIHPDLRVSTHADDAPDLANSLDRQFTYRGTYNSKTDGSGVTKSDGEKFPLTNKLDYAFYRRPTAKTENISHIDNNAVEHDPATAWTASANDTTADQCFPYVNGWAVIQDIKNIENVWTTFGVGELEDADPKGSFTASVTDPDNPSAASTTVNYNFATYDDSGYFDLADFSNLDKLPDGQNVLYVKALYEEGTELDKAADYTLFGDVSYTRYSNVATTSEGSTYSIQFQYARVGNDGRGVGRTRDPAVKLYYTIDKEAAADQTFFIEVAASNTDVVDVEFTPTGSFLTMDYSFVEKYGTANFIEGIARTAYGNKNSILKNFNYDDGWSYESRLGSTGFVYVGTVNQVLEIGTEAVRTSDTSNFLNTLNFQTFQDLNLKRDAAGTDITSPAYAGIVASQILDAIEKALTYGGLSMLDDNGNVVLDWHQLQYHIINYDAGGIYQGGKILTKDECIAKSGGYTWCHQDECGGGATAITSLADLMKAALKVSDNSVPTALDKLNAGFVDTLYFCKDERGYPFANLNDFKAALVTAAGKLASDGPYTAADIGTATWKEIQYALIHGAYAANGTITEDYWWQGGDTPSISTLGDLLDVGYKAYVDGHNPAVLTRLSMSAVNKLYLRADTAGAKFASLDGFKAALEHAVQGLAANGYTASNIRGADWIELQHLLIPGNPYVPAATLRDDPDINYWWEAGGTPPITTAGDLMKAAYGVYVEGDDPLMLSGANTTKLKELELMSDLDGAPFASSAAIQTALEAAVKALTTAPGPYDGTTVGTASWEEIQYAMIHGAYAAEGDIAEVYWWKNGGAPTITAEGDIFKYAYKVYEAGGDAKLLDNVTLAKLDEFYLRSADSGAKFNNRSLFLSALQGAVHALVNDGGLDGTTIAAADWKEYQYALINGGYKSLADIEDDVTIDYWWQNGNTKTISTLEDLLQAAYFVYGDGSDPAALDSIDDTTVATFGQAPFWLRSEAENGTPFATAAEFKAALQHVIAESKAYKNASTIGTLTWVQVQYMLLDDDADGMQNPYASDSALIGQSTASKYWWLNDGSKPTGTPVDLVMQQITIAVSRCHEYMDGEDPTDTLALINSYLAALQLKNGGGTPYSDATTLFDDLTNMMYPIYDDYLPQYLDADETYVQMTWNEVQHYLYEGTFAEEGTFDSYAWRPALVEATNAALVMELLAKMDILVDFVSDEPIAESPFVEPEVSGTPESEAPVEPEPPVLPEESVIPEEPGAPEVPVVPEEPEAPVTPEEPMIPEEPGATPSTGEAGPPPPSSEGEADGDEGDEGAQSAPLQDGVMELMAVASSLSTQSPAHRPISPATALPSPLVPARGTPHPYVGLAANGWTAGTVAQAKPVTEGASVVPLPLTPFLSPPTALGEPIWHIPPQHESRRYYL